jgi:hypothetical protein
VGKVLDEQTCPQTGKTAAPVEVKEPFVIVTSETWFGIELRVKSCYHVLMKKLSWFQRRKSAVLASCFRASNGGYWEYTIFLRIEVYAFSVLPPKP